MKNNKNIIFAIFISGLLGFSSCSKFLEEDVRSGKTLETYFKTEAEAQAQINALYRRGAPTNYSSAGSAYIGPSASVNSMLTGYFTNSYEGQELVCLYARQLSRQENVSIVSNTTNNIWRDAYQAIAISNGGIKYIPGIPMNEDRRKLLLAEAKYFRAANYFYLVKDFRGCSTDNGAV